jgi:DNA topoisomerase-6 subunit B
MLKNSEHKHLGKFLVSELGQVGRKRAAAIIDGVDGLTARSYTRRIARSKAASLHAAIAQTPIPAPPTSCVVPIGREELLAGLRREVPAQFYTAVSRRPAVYRGNPFVVEVGLAYGETDMARVEVDEDGHLVRHGSERPSAASSPARVLRFANRVPLLYQQGHCATTQAIAEVNWRRYGLDQPAGGLPVGPLAIVVHVASVWVPYTSESKDAIASYEEIDGELRLGLQACGRELAGHVKSHRRLEQELARRQTIERYVPHVATALAAILDEDEPTRARLETELVDLVHQTRAVP